MPAPGDDCHQPDDRLQEALRRTQAKVEHRSHDQGALDRGVRV